MGRRGWLGEMDTVRGLTALAVVAGHAVVGPSTPLLAFLNRQITVSVPAFLFLSAFLLFYRHPDGVPRGLALRQLKRVVLPYLFWMALYLGLPALMGITRPPDARRILLDLAGAGFHLYFIPIVVQFYLLFQLNRLAAFRRLLQAPWVLAASLLVTLGSQHWLGDAERAIFPDFYLLFPVWGFYFVLGAQVAHRWEEVRYRLMTPGTGGWLAASALAGVYLLGTQLPRAAVYEPLVQVATLLLLPGLLGLAARLPRGNPFQRLAPYSYGIYLIHRLPYDLFGAWFAFLGPWLHFWVSLLLQGGVGVGLSWLLARVPVLAWTVGLPGRRAPARAGDGRPGSDTGGRTGVTAIEDDAGAGDTPTIEPGRLSSFLPRRLASTGQASARPRGAAGYPLLAG